jgi:DNA-binding response OmpR family regulator
MSNTDLSSKIILVIEDSQVCLALIRAFFRDTGAVLLIAGTAREGWKMFSDNKIDIVLTDLRLPDSDGLTLVRRMKRTKPDVPVIIQTACTVDFTVDECFEAGCDDYISKPYPRSAFMKVVLRNLSARETHFLRCC